MRPLICAFLLAAGLPALANDGKATYDNACAMCHTPGLANAPKLGDKAAWGPRLAGGAEALVKSAIAGKGAMPPKGGMPNLEDAKVRAAVEYMVASVK